MGVLGPPKPENEWTPKPNHYTTRHGHFSQPISHTRDYTRDYYIWPINYKHDGNYKSLQKARSLRTPRSDAASSSASVNPQGALLTPSTV